MLTVLILVCSLSSTPNLADCNPGNARIVIRGPEGGPNPALCLAEGQAYLAESALGEIGADEAPKIVCAPARRAEAK